MRVEDLIRSLQEGLDLGLFDRQDVVTLEAGYEDHSELKQITRKKTRFCSFELMVC